MNEHSTPDQALSDECSLIVVATATTDEAYAHALAAQWQLPLIKRHSIEDCKQNPPGDFSLIIGSEAGQARIVLQPHCFDSGAIEIDFTGGKARHRLNFGGGKKQPLAKAIGLSHKKRPKALAEPITTDTHPLFTVCDATGGFGKDAWVLASLGCQMVILERSNWLCSMLELAVDSAKKDHALATIAHRIGCHNVDAIKWLSGSVSAHDVSYDVIYMDPMYPSSDKSASVKKDMQALHRLIGPDTDSSKLLEVAVETAAWRVVVKRPKKAQPIEHDRLTPMSSIKSVNTRYDIYTAGQR